MGKYKRDVEKKNGDKETGGTAIRGGVEQQERNLGQGTAAVPPRKLKGREELKDNRR